MAGVSKEQVERAKQIGILDYILSHEPDNVRRVGGAYYLRDHESFEISNGLWRWHSRGIGGKNVVDYLMKVRGYGFVDAVRRLAGGDANYEHAAPKAKPPTVRKPFALPPRNGDNGRVIAYLQSRGIDRQAILDCIRQGSLYESARWHNAVFVGRDENGKARCASMRGTAGGFKRDADGSDKRFGFILPPKDGASDAVAVTESPVDALSHQTLRPEFGGWRLSLGCTALAALTHFLERHGEVRNVAVCTDNDAAGNASAARIADLPGIAAARHLPPAGCKDWNDALVAINHETSRASKPSLLWRLEAATAEAADVNGVAARERQGDRTCR